MSQESIDYSLSSSDDENLKPKPSQSLLELSRAIDQETDITKSQVNEPAGIHHEQMCANDHLEQLSNNLSNQKLSPSPPQKVPSAAPSVAEKHPTSHKRELDVDDISFMSSESLNFAQATMQRPKRQQPKMNAEDLISLRSSAEEVSLRESKRSVDDQSEASTVRDYVPREVRRIQAEIEERGKGKIQAITQTDSQILNQIVLYIEGSNKQNAQK